MVLLPFFLFSLVLPCFFTGPIQYRSDQRPSPYTVPYKMGGSRSERRRRVRHALSVLGEARTFLEENPDASDVAIKCVDGTFRFVPEDTIISYHQLKLTAFT